MGKACLHVESQVGLEYDGSPIRSG
jgi:hypothetical protein